MSQGTKPAGRVFLGLVHYPIYNKRREIVATSITNLDIHDISRLAATFDLAKYFLIHPHPSQHKIVGELLEFWQKGYGAEYNPDRQKALERVCLAESLEGAREWIQSRYPGPVISIVTDAHNNADAIGYSQLRQRIWEEEANYFLLFGTGHGLAASVMETADLILAPVLGRDDYNHLSVRSAAAIILDRLLGS